MPQKSKKNKSIRVETNKDTLLMQETIYKKQLIRLHSYLGADMIPKYDTGEPIE